MTIGGQRFGSWLVRVCFLYCGGVRGEKYRFGQSRVGARALLFRDCSRECTVLRGLVLFHASWPQGRFWRYYVCVCTRRGGPRHFYSNFLGTRKWVVLYQGFYHLRHPGQNGYVHFHWTRNRSDQRGTRCQNIPSWRHRRPQRLQ